MKVVYQVFMNPTIGRDKSVGRGPITRIVESRHTSTGLSDEKPSGINVPAIEFNLPVAIKPTVGKVCEIQCG